jgi:hypothetical protein
VPAKASKDGLEVGKAGRSQGVVVDGTVSVGRDSRLDGGGHLVRELVKDLQEPTSDLRHLFGHLCIVTI